MTVGCWVRGVSRTYACVSEYLCFCVSGSCVQDPTPFADLSHMLVPKNSGKPRDELGHHCVPTVIGAALARVPYFAKNGIGYYSASMLCPRYLQLLDSALMDSQKYYFKRYPVSLGMGRGVNGLVAQTVEHVPVKGEDRGSNPRWAGGGGIPFPFVE